MKYDMKIAKRLEYCFGKYTKVALYGTGNVADMLWKYLLKYDLLSSLDCVVDRDDSVMIGKTYNGYPVNKLEDVLEDIDAVFIASFIYWKEIQVRIQDIIEEYHINIPVLAIADEAQRVRENSIEDYEQYVNYLEKLNDKVNSEFMPLTISPYQREKGDPKVIAFYLPQYYRIDINDRYHGAGFTEWTNSSKGFPLFIGHEQPHIPYDVGYYDLTNPYTLQRQAELANLYGIYGFCFHYYWFSGEKTMEKPAQILLEHKEISIHYCFDWANENWTTSWDGGRFDTIFEQRIQDGDAEKFVNDLIPFFEDDRYIKIDGRPVLCVLEPDIFEEGCKELFLKLRELIQKAGFPDIYLTVTNHRGKEIDLLEVGADAMVEFQPDSSSRYCMTYIPEGYINPYFAGLVVDYGDLVDNRKYMTEYSCEKYFRSALVGFDDTPRRSKWGGAVFMGSTPDRFQQWLRDILIESKKVHAEAENIVFVNSWNEWAEGSHLEPDLRYGYAKLNAVKQALYESRGLDTDYIKRCVEKVPQGEQISFYVKCVESMGDIVACEPVARYLKEAYADSHITWLVRSEFRDVVAYNPYVDEIKEVTCLTEADNICRNITNATVIVDCHFDGRICTTGTIHFNKINPSIHEGTYFDYGSLLESFSLTAGMDKLTMAPLFHQKQNVNNVCSELKRYIVIHCVSSDPAKDYPQRRWRKIVEHIISEGYDVVEIGFHPLAFCASEHYHDMTGTHDLQEIAAIIKSAVFFAGIDSGFAHIANCFRIPGMILIGRYKNFSRPMPYTGYYAEHKDEFILYPRELNDNVKAITVDEVINCLNKAFLNYLRPC